MRRLIAGFACIALMAYPKIAQAQETNLAKGIQAYTAADYRTAITLLEALNESELRPDERIVRHKYLAFALIARKEHDRGQEEFINLLMLEPEYELSEREVSPAILEHFQRSKATQGSRLCDHGIQAYTEERFEQAVSDLDQALRFNPRDARAKEFQKLARNRLKEEQDSKIEPCVPSLTWGELDAKAANCQGVDYNTGFKLPARANRITLIYSKHHFGAGTCWKLVLYDPTGKEILTLDDPGGTFAKKEDPGVENRWRVVELPEVVTVGRVVMFAEGGRSLERHRLGKYLADEFILEFEVTCPSGALQQSDTDL